MAGNRLIGQAGCRHNRGWIDHFFLIKVSQIMNEAWSLGLRFLRTGRAWSQPGGRRGVLVGSGLENFSDA